MKKQEAEDLYKPHFRELRATFRGYRFRVEQEGPWVGIRADVPPNASEKDVIDGVRQFYEGKGVEPLPDIRVNKVI